VPIEVTYDERHELCGTYVGVHPDETKEALEYLVYEERAVPRFREALLRLSADERLDDSEQEALAAAHSVLVALTRARKIMEADDA